jgi:hypothetical protein
MTSHTPMGNKLVEQIQQKLAKATDLSKLLTDNKFLEQLKMLPQADQLKIFEKYKDEFTKISKDPASAISQWTSGLTKSLPMMNIGQDTLNNGIQQGQQILEDLRNSFGQKK